MAEGGRWGSGEGAVGKRWGSRGEAVGRGGRGIFPQVRRRFHSRGEGTGIDRRLIAREMAGVARELHWVGCNFKIDTL